MKKLFLLFGTLFLTTPCLAYESKWFAKIQLGSGIQTVKDSDYLPENNESLPDSDVTIELALSIGRQFSNGLFLELAARGSNESFLFHDEDDGYSRREFQRFIGYTFFISPRLTLTPKIGFSDWKLSYNNINDQDQYISEEYYGNSTIFSSDLGFHINDYLTLSLGMNYGRYDFGYTHLASFGCQINF